MDPTSNQHELEYPFFCFKLLLNRSVQFILVAKTSKQASSCSKSFDMMNLGYGEHVSENGLSKNLPQPRSSNLTFHSRDTAEWIIYLL